MCRSRPVSAFRSASAAARKLRVQHSHGLPSGLRLSQRTQMKGRVLGSKRDPSPRRIVGDLPHLFHRPPRVFGYVLERSHRLPRQRPAEPVGLAAVVLSDGNAARARDPDEVVPRPERSTRQRSRFSLFGDSQEFLIVPRISLAKVLERRNPPAGVIRRSDQVPFGGGVPFPRRSRDSTCYHAVGVQSAG